MAFGQLGNRHDRWLAFLDFHRALLVESGLPNSIAISEERFRDPLREGSAVGQGVTASLAEFPVGQWAGLTRFVTLFFREYESYDPLALFPAFRREVERRDVSSATSR